MPSRISRVFTLYVNCMGGKCRMITQRFKSDVVDSNDTKIENLESIDTSIILYQLTVMSPRRVDQSEQYLKFQMRFCLEELRRTN
jgi:hypothetical protein